MTRASTNDAYSWTGSVTGSTTTVPNGLNQIATKAAAAFTYDANGNLAGDGTTTFSYDVENRLTAAALPTNPPTLSYDPLGRLWENAAGTGATRFLYDGDALIAQYDTGGALWRRYVHGPSVDEALVQYEGVGAATRRWLHADERGSIIALSDDAGAMTAIDRYDEYGVPQSTNAGAFQYTGQRWISELGAYYYKARFYRPGDGIFMQTDPVGYDGGVNLYAYVGNDPINIADPLGLYRCLNKKACDQYEDTKKTLSKVANQLSRSKNMRDRSVAEQIRKGIEDLGTRGVNNGTSINANLDINSAQWNPNENSLEINTSSFESQSSLRKTGIIGHEFTHIIQDKAALDLGPKNRMQLERQAYINQAIIEHALGPTILWDNSINNYDRFRVYNQSRLSCLDALSQDDEYLCR